MILQEKNIHMVKIYDNVIPSKACKNFIDLFENSEDHQEYIDYNGCPCFTQLNLNQLSPNIVSFFNTFIWHKYTSNIKMMYDQNICHL